MDVSKKENLQPEKWLKEEASFQLEKIIAALNAAHTMPFKCLWLEKESGRTYLELLKEMESMLLLIWSRLENDNISKIEQQVLVWYGKQKRSQKNIFCSYYQLHEQLTEFGNSPEAQTFGLSGTWSNYLLFVMTVVPNIFSKAASGKISLPSAEREKFASLFLSKMQMIHRAEPHQICTDFFTWISPFTQESVFLPACEDADSQQTKFTAFNDFRKELIQTNKWNLLNEMYLNVLDELAEKRNELHEVGKD
ncbi:MAG: hypothetical protein MAG581_02079 [Deltaproteobacteria bacterium]|jgi:hypothetical protein|nr:hypothetical protein [Deltaproteobacteria bacterium]